MLLRQEGRKPRYNELLELLMQEFSVSHATASRDIARAYEVINAQIEAEAPAIAAYISREWRSFYEEARFPKDPITGEGRPATIEEKKLAKDILKELAKLHGVNAPTKVKVEGSVSDEERAMIEAMKMSPIERKKRTQALAAEIAAANESLTAIEDADRVIDVDAVEAVAVPIDQIVDLES